AVAGAGRVVPGQHRTLRADDKSAVLPDGIVQQARAAAELAVLKQPVAPRLIAFGTFEGRPGRRLHKAGFGALSRRRIPDGIPLRPDLLKGPGECRSCRV